MENDQKLMEEKFESLPQELKDAISSVEIGKLIADIGDEQGLMLDQSADLIEEAGLVMLGITPTELFTRKLQRRLGIDEKKANTISAQINEKVFNKIRSSLQKIQAENEAIEETQIEEMKVQSPAPQAQPIPSKPLTPLEKAGNLEIIKDRPVSSSPQYNDTNLNKAKILDGIENPPTNQRVSIVDHLLANPVSSTNNTATQTPKAEPAAPQKPVTPATPAPISPNPLDPYREPIE